MKPNNYIDLGKNCEFSCYYRVIIPYLACLGHRDSTSLRQHRARPLGTGGKTGTRAHIPIAFSVGKLLEQLRLKQFCLDCCWDCPGSWCF